MDNQCYEYLRQHDRFIWQTPAIVVIVDGALLVSSFGLVDVWWVREVILACALVLTTVLTIALIKHRYFAEIEQGTLTVIEKQKPGKVIQRTTNLIESKKNYWYTKKPVGFQKLSAVKYFVIGMWAIVGLLIILMILNAILLRDNPSPLCSQPVTSYQHYINYLIG